MPPISYVNVWQLVIVLLVDLIILQHSLSPLFGFFRIFGMVMSPTHTLCHLLFTLLRFYCSSGVLLERGNHTTALDRYVVERVPTRPTAFLQPLIRGLPHLAVLFKLILDFILLHWACYWFLHALTPLLLPYISIRIARWLALNVVRIHNGPIIVIMEEWLLVVDALAVLICKRFPLLRTFKNHFLFIFQSSI